MKFGRQKKKRTYLAPEKILIIKQVLFGILLFSLVALLITGIWYGTRVSSLTINTVSVSEGKTISSNVVEEKVNEILVGEYWRLVPRRFAWFYPEKEIFNQVQEIERIKDVKVERLSGTEISVTFDEYIPYALWCSEDDERCLFLDKEGYAFGSAPDLSGGSLTRYFKLGEEPQLKTVMIDQTDFVSTEKFVSLLSTVGWFVSRVEVDSVRDVFYVTSGGGELRVTLRDDPQVPFSRFETLLQSEEFSHLEPGSFEYVDLRFGEKLYVNEGGEETEATSTDPVNEEVSELQVEADEDE